MSGKHLAPAAHALGYELPGGKEDQLRPDGGIWDHLVSLCAPRIQPLRAKENSLDGSDGCFRS